MANNVNANLFDSAMQHAVIVEMLYRKTLQDTQRILDRSDRAVRKLIASGDTSKLGSLFVSIKKEIDAGYDEVFRVARKDISSLIDNEVTFNHAALERQVGKALSLKKPNISDIRKALLDSNIAIGDIKGKTFTAHLRGLANSELKQVRSGLRQALVLGLNSKQAVDFIYDNAKFSAPSRLTRSQFAAVLRTTITDTQSFSAIKTFEANSDIIEKYKYIATLDSRTSPICQRLDGGVWRVGEGPRPPQHFNCRSAIVPIVKAYDDIPANLKKRGISEATRASINGQVPATQDHTSWLTGKSAAFQNKVLGPQIADVFRAGNVTTNQLVSNFGRHLSVGAARTLDNRLTDGEPVGVLTGAQNAGVGNVELVLNTNKKLINKANRSAILEMVATINKFKNSNQARINDKRPGPNRFDPDTGVEVVDDRLSFASNRWAKVRANAKQMLDDGVISKAEYKFLEDLRPDLERRFGIEGNQIITVYQTFAKLLANGNGYSGSGGRFKLGTDVGLPSNINDWFRATLNTNAKFFRKKIAAAPLSEATPISEIYKLRSRNDRIDRFERRVIDLSSNTEIMQQIESSLKALGLSTSSIEEVSSAILSSITRRLNNSAEITSIDIGQYLLAHNDILPRFKDAANIGARILDDLEGLLPFRYARETRSVPERILVGAGPDAQFRYSGRNIKQPFTRIVPTSKGWIQHGIDIRDQRVFSKLPKTNKGIGVAKVGDRYDIDGDAYITADPKVVTNRTLTKGQADKINHSNKVQFSLVDDYINGIEKIAELYPELLAKGGYWKNGFLTDKYYRLIEAIKANGPRNIQYNHIVGTNGRVYPKGYPLNPNGDQWNKGLHQFADAEAFLDELAVDVFHFEAADYLGALKLKSGRTANLNSVNDRIKLTNEYLPRLEDLGEALAKGVSNDKLKDAFKILTEVKKPGRVMAVAIEAYRMKAWRGRHGGSIVGYRSRYKSDQDATASASQLAAILTRNRELGIDTNIVTDLSTDGLKQVVYTKILPGLQGTKVWNDIALIKAVPDAEWLSVLKTPVMTILYNVKTGARSFNSSDLTGIASQLRLGIKELIDDNEVYEGLRPLYENLTDKEWISIAVAVSRQVDADIPALPALQGFLTKFGAYASNKGRPITYQTPLTKSTITYGVRQTDIEVREFTIGGRDHRQVVDNILEDIDSRDTGRTTSPLIIHSLDADLADYTKANSKSVVYSNHDSFSTHLATYGEVNRVLKQGLIDLDKAQWLQDLIEQGLRNKLLTQQEYDDLLSDLTSGFKLGNGDTVPLSGDLGDYIEGFLDNPWPFS